MNISQGAIETLLENNETLLKRDHIFLKVNKLISLLKNDKIYIPDSEYQRPFRFNQKQFTEIIITIKRNMMLQSISLVDHQKQIEWLENELYNTTDSIKKIQIQKELEYYNGLYINGHGYLYSLVDGQHRGNYVRILQDMINYYGLEALYNSEIDIFFNIELFSWIVWGVYRDDMVVLFQSINTARNINTDGKIWGINTDFNNQLKELAVGDKRLDVFANGSPEEKNRANYKIWFNILKICGGHENSKICTPATSKNAMTMFVKSDKSLKDFQSIIDIYDDFKRIIEQLENINGQYTVFNLYFILHRIKMNDINLTDVEIIKLFYECNYAVSTQLGNPERYREIKNYIN